MKHTIEIPDDYEFDHVAPPLLGNGGGAITVIIKKKQTKDFDWFVDQYLPVRDNSTSDEIIDWIEGTNVSKLNTYLKAKQFNLVPWEIKIGLFRFICEEFKYNWFASYTSVKYENVDSDKLKDILPQEFIDDLFK